MARIVRYGVCLLALAAAATAEVQRHTARLMLDDGIPLQEAPTIIVGLTSYRLPACTILTVFGNGTVHYEVDLANRPEDPLTVDVCPINIRLDGYKTTDATLRQDAVIVLKRVGAPQGSSISMTELKAPPQARKAYENGVAAMVKKKWDVAQPELERAVAIYPQYAPAWTDLGEVLSEQSKAQDARAAWERSIQADPKYLRPYQLLAKQALDEKRSEDALRISDRAVEMRPFEFPGIYYYNAVANYNLKNLVIAERQCRRAIELDVAREIPLAESLLGSILAAKGENQEALVHLRKYLELSPKATDAGEVQQLAEKVERDITGSQ